MVESARFRVCILSVGYVPIYDTGKESLSFRKVKKLIFYEIEQKIRDLKTKLSCQESDIGDWKIAKCIEYSTLGMESPYDLQELHKQRQVIRDEIGALEEELAKCEDEDEAASEK